MIMALKRSSDTEEDDDTFYYRYPSAPSSSFQAHSSSSSFTDSDRRNVKSGSGGLAPSKSTLYVSNLDYALTNSDLHTLFSTFGRIARVTVLKHRVSRQSKGVAFIQYVSRQDAVSAAGQMNLKILNGRTISASIAADNGRAPEFIRKRVYRDKSRCYECGENGHLSYECPRNQLGPRERPVPKRERRVGAHRRSGEDEEEWSNEEGGDDGFEDNWASAVDGEAGERLLNGSGKGMDRKKSKTVSYFSDESDEEE